MQRLLIAIFFVGVGSCVEADTLRFVPVSGVVLFSARHPEEEQTLKVESTGNFRTDYILKLVPDLDINGDVAALELKLMETASINDPDAPNLLDPSGQAHGLQKYSFAASDLKDGPNSSIYGSVRTIDLPEQNMAVEITVSSVDVARVASSESQFEFTINSLKLLVALRHRN